MPVPTSLAVEVARAGILSWSPSQIELAGAIGRSKRLEPTLWIPFLRLPQKAGKR
jgi:hypothetical protein